ncbi:MAG: isoprenoid biosynthesis glyoxalase ElbB [Desulfobacteraceae bacterium]|nr:isoprenoid biosynthesis glyoxalase ElbB [Desulfobacteraceae bacterium]
MAKRIGVLLAGCGVFDGSEIHEAVLTLLYLDRAGVEILCMAPDMDQLHIIDHSNQAAVEGKRNVLTESARIARGNIVDLAKVSAKQLDALIIPGGFGAAKNLSTFAVKGPDCKVHPQVQRILDEMVAAQKPIGALCIAPATVVRALAGRHPQVTIGTDMGTAAAIETMGGKHIQCKVDEVHVDTKNKIVSTPAYMLGPSIKNIAVGIEKLVKKVVEMA